VNGIEYSGINNFEGTLVVAEISANHKGDLDKAKALVRAAKDAGADAVKFQTYTAETITLNSSSGDFLLPTESPWIKFGTYFELYLDAFTPWEWHSELFNLATELDLIPFSSPFDESAVEFLESLNCPIYKLASPEINHTPLIESIARTGKPIWISLGTASEYDLVLAISTFRQISQSEIVLMQCETSYPAEESNSNLSMLSRLSKEFNFSVGYSDHTVGILAPVVATALGAKVIEKHLTDFDDDPSVDEFFSLKPDQFAKMVEQIRATEGMLGKQEFRSRGGANSTQRNQRSIYPSTDINAGELFSAENLKIVRPGLGLAPKMLVNLIGKRASRFIKAGERIKAEDVLDL